MKSRRFVILAGLSFTTVNLLSCSRQASTQPATTATLATSPEATSPITEPAKQMAQAPRSTILRSGKLVDGEHPTRGTVRIVGQGNQRRLELDSTFTTSTSGPDLVVILHRLADVIGSTTPPAFPIKQGDYVVLAPLKRYRGAQSYPIPNSINLDHFKSAAIWCRRFNATFGSATLQ